MAGGYTTYADPVMTAIEPSWLVPGFLEFGQVILLTGPGGCGKSFLTAHWSAAATRGELPGLDGEPASVGLINMEDDPNTATAWRLGAENAVLSRIIDLSESGAGEPAELPRDSGLLRRAIDENGIKLLIIDPLSAVSSRSLTTVLQARKIIMPLQRAARETGCAIIVVHHVRKDGMIAGSKGLVDSVRMALTLAPDEQVPSDRVLSVSKTNGTAPAVPLRFTIEGDGTGAHVAWLDREITTQRRTSWRDRLTARTPAPAALVTPQQARAAGCRHSRSKFGTPAQCGDCPARKLRATVPAPAPAPSRPSPVRVPSAPAPAAPVPAVLGWNAYMAAGAAPVQLSAREGSASAAQAVCAATPQAQALAAAGIPLQWQQDASGVWTAGTAECGFAVAPIQARRSPA